MSTQPFIFSDDPRTGAPTLEQVKKHREVLDAMASRRRIAQSVPEGLTQIGEALLSRFARSRLDAQEAELAGAATADFNAAFGSYGTPAAGTGSSPLDAAPAAPETPSVPFAGDLRSGIVSTAQSLGIDPVDLATTISYETAGTFDPTKRGPTTQWGQHRGLIQFGEPQAQQYGVSWDDPIGSQLGPDGAVAKYLRATGVKPGMGLLDIYSAVNAGGVGRYNRSDANNGGAPGTVADKVNNQMSGHRAKAQALLDGLDLAPLRTRVASLDPSAGFNQPRPAEFGPEDAARVFPRDPQAVPYSGPGMVVDDRDLAALESGTFGQLPTSAFAPTTAQPSNAQDAITGLSPPVDPWAGAREADVRQPVQVAQAGQPRTPAQMLMDQGITPEMVRAMSNPNLSAPQRALLQIMMEARQKERALAAQQAYDAQVRDEERAYQRGLTLDERRYDSTVRQEGYGREDAIRYEGFDREDSQRQQDFAREDRRNVEEDALRREGFVPNDVREYEYAKGQGYTGTFAQWTVDQKKAGATNINNNLGGDNKQVFTAMEASAAAAASAAQGLNAIREARKAVEGGIITGAGADYLLTLQKVGAAFGVTDPETIQNTETFRAAIAPQVSAVLKATVGSANISNTDREFAEKAAGGNITLDEGSIRRLLDIMERAGRAAVETHRSRLDRVYPMGQGFDRERALFDVLLPQAPEAAPTENGIPTGVDPADWEYMTPEDRALFR